MGLIAGMPLMAAGPLLIAVVVGALATLANILLAPRPRSGLADKEATTLASRGARFPVIIGTIRTGAHFLWVGERRSRNEGGSGGKGGGGGSSGQSVYLESAWHGICVGPAEAILRIWVDGKEVLTSLFPSGITDSSHISGTTVDLGDEGAFDIYWGEQAQPVNSFLGDANRVGISSRWPLLCYVLWNSKRLGSSPRWPVIEYEVRAQPQGTSVSGSAMLTNTGGADNPNDGANPAFIVDQLICATHPYGIGLPRADFDAASMGTLATLAVTEHLAFDVAVRDGDTVAGIVGQVMQDAGFLLTMVDGLLTAVPIRGPVTSRQQLSEDLLLPPFHEDEKLIEERPVDHLVFQFQDRKVNHRDNAIVIDDDGQATLTSAKRGRSIPVKSTRNFTAAARVADRRGQEELADKIKFRIWASRGARWIYAGQVIEVHGIPRALRVLSVQPDALSGRTEIEAVPEYYGVADTGYEPDPAVVATPQGVPTADVAAEPMIEPPPELQGLPGVVAPSPIRLGVARIRADETVAGADVHISADGTTYHYVGTDRTEWQGGALDEAMPIGAFDLESGPIFTALGPDIARALDLTGADDDWRTGRQVALIGGEVLFVRNVEALGGSQYRLRGVMRGRFATGQVAHAIGAKVFIAQWRDVAAFLDPLLIPGETIYVKTQPFNSTGGIDLSSVTASTAVVPQVIPRAPTALRSDSWIYSSSGGSVTFRWCYSAPTVPRSGYGLQQYGEVVTQPAAMGTFEIELSSADAAGSMTFTPGATASQAVTPANVLAAFGSYPQTIRVRVRENALGKLTDWSAYHEVRKEG